jgi:hypothetical protein
MSITEDDVLASITAKSDQLNACDLVGGPITVTITSVTKGAADQPIAIGIGKDRQPYKPCKSMRRVLVACWGANPNAWINRSMTLFCDQSVKWAGEEVGGIRISHMSHISAEKKVLLNATKGKKAAYIVKPLLVSSDVSERVAKAIAAINSAKDSADLERIWKQAEKLYAVASEEQQMQMDVARDERKSLV